MATVDQLLESHPGTILGDEELLIQAIEGCFDCLQICEACADACLSEAEVQQLRRCIRLNLDCADICDATGRMLTRQTEPEVTVLRAQLQACIEACRACGAECAQHAEHMDMAHCRVCAEACRDCAESCDRLMKQIAA